MRGFLKGAVLAATITTAQAQDAAPSNLPSAPDASVELLEMAMNASVLSGRFILENNLQMQPLRVLPDGEYSGYDHTYIAIPCDDLTTDFEKSVNYIDKNLTPVLISIDHKAIRPSIEAAVKKAAEQCSPAIM